MTVLMRMPMRRLVSKSLETARIAMPTLVYLMRSVKSTTSTMVRIGVTTVTILVVEPQIVIVWLSHGMAGYTFARPPVKYSAAFCNRYETPIALIMTDMRGAVRSGL